MPFDFARVDRVKVLRQDDKVRKLAWSDRLNPDTQQLRSLLDLRQEKQVIDYRQECLRQSSPVPLGLPSPSVIRAYSKTAPLL